jgi:hypothetical protein
LAGVLGFAFSRLFIGSLAEVGLSWLVILFFELVLISSGLHLVFRARGRRIRARASRYAGYLLISFGLFFIALLAFV